MSQKSYNNTPTLFLIPTPIGNLEDITIRALNILKEVSVIFTEDTRVTSRLLNHYNIKNKLISNHEYNELENKDKIIKYLKEGLNVGLVSDRGTPVISDPGYILVKHVIENGYNVVALPGATALIPALIVSGINPNTFTFAGFLDSKETKRKKQIENLKKLETTIIIYESPHRIIKTLQNIEEIMGNITISISREITKKFEEIYRGKILDILPKMEQIKGELVVIIEGQSNVNNYENISVIEHVNMYIKEGKDVKEAIKLVAKERNVNRKEIYNEYHNIK